MSKIKRNEISRLILRRNVLLECLQVSQKFERIQYFQEIPYFLDRNEYEKYVEKNI